MSQNKGEAKKVQPVESNLFSLLNKITLFFVVVEIDQKSNMKKKYFKATTFIKHKIPNVSY